MEKELNNCLKIFELMGLQYFSLKSLTKENANGKISTLRSLGGFVLLIILLGFMAFYIYSNNAKSIKIITAKNVLMFVIQNSMNFGLLLVVLTTIIQSYCTTRSVKKIFLNTKQLTDTCCQEFQICVDFRRIKKATWKKISVISIFFVTVHGISTYYQAKNLLDALPMIIGAVPIFFLLIVAYKFVFYVNMINSQLSFLNAVIKKIISEQPSNVVENISFRVVPVFPEKQSNPITTLRKLRVARQIFNLIYENGNLTNNSNGLSILVLLIDLVISLMASGYEVFVIIIGDQTMERIPQTIYVILNCSALLIALVSYSQATSNIVSFLDSNLIGNYHF